MAVFGRDDLKGIFILLAIAYLFDSFLSGYVFIGVAVSAIMVALVFFSDNPGSQVIKNFGSNNELLVRVSVAAVLIGILVLNPWVIALGLFVGMVLLFSDNQSLTINIWGLEIPQGQARSTSAHKMPSRTGKIR
ncbi:MAG: hypothetical protein KGH64_01185 [Candidatus Micrarchaeota archaeon]|nr:hypothetical protein [Candidatus Micrarchaeota archaeon]MDE1859870.1 hypothetical protein [Candidatus Micrarchaeota archaeon]